MSWSTFWEVIIDAPYPVYQVGRKPCAVVRPYGFNSTSDASSLAVAGPSNAVAHSRNRVPNEVPATGDDPTVIVLRRCPRHLTVSIPDASQEVDVDAVNTFQIAIPNLQFSTEQTTQDNKVYVRRIISHYIANEQLQLSGRAIVLAIRKKLKFRISLKKMLKRLTKMGYHWYDTKTIPMKNIIVESAVLRLQRENYIQILEQYRAEGRPIIYLSKYFDYVSHRGTDRYNTFTLNACSGTATLPQFIEMYEIAYSNQLEEEQFQICKKWIRNKVIPKIPSNAVIVLVNLPFQNRIVNPPTESDANKQTMRFWLLINTIPIKINMCKPQLYNLINQSKEHVTEYYIDRLFDESTGDHPVVHCPPQHYDLDMTHLFWGDVLYKQKKVKPHSIRIDLYTAIIKHLIQMSVQKITYMQRQIINNEKDYTSCDLELDTLTDHYGINCNLRNRERKLKRLQAEDTRRFYV